MVNVPLAVESSMLDQYVDTSLMPMPVYLSETCMSFLNKQTQNMAMNCIHTFLFWEFCHMMRSLGWDVSTSVYYKHYSEKWQHLLEVYIVKMVKKNCSVTKMLILSVITTLILTISVILENYWHLHSEIFPHNRTVNKLNKQARKVFPTWSQLSTGVISDH